MTAVMPIDRAVVGQRRQPAGAAGPRPAGPAGTRPQNRSTSGGGPDRIATMVRGFVALFLEIEAGRRPRSHLAPLMTPMLFARLTDVWVRGGCPGRVRSVLVASSGPATIDVVALVERGPRCGAVALRLVRGTRGWLVDEIAMPEHGRLPLPAYRVAAEEPDDDDLALIPPVTAAGRFP